MNKTNDTNQNLHDKTVAQSVVHDIRSAVSLYFSPLRAAARVAAKNICSDTEQPSRPTVKKPRNRLRMRQK